MTKETGTGVVATVETTPETEPVGVERQVATLEVMPMAARGKRQGQPTEKPRGRLPGRTGVTLVAATTATGQGRGGHRPAQRPLQGHSLSSTPTRTATSDSCSISQPQARVWQIFLLEPCRPCPQICRGRAWHLCPIPQRSNQWCQCQSPAPPPPNWTANDRPSGGVVRCCSGTMPLPEAEASF